MILRFYLFRLFIYDYINLRSLNIIHNKETTTYTTKLLFNTIFFHFIISLVAYFFFLLVIFYGHVSWYSSPMLFFLIIKLYFICVAIFILKLSNLLAK